MDNSAIAEAYKGLAGAQAGITKQMELSNQERQDREKRRREESNRHHEAINKAQIEAASQRKEQLSTLTDAAEDVRQNRDIVRQTEAERLRKLEIDGEMCQNELKTKQQNRIDSTRVQAGEQAAQQTERIGEQLHSRRRGMEAQSNANKETMDGIKSAYNEQKLEQNTDLEEKKREIAELKNLNREMEKNERIEYKLEKQKIDQEKLLTQKAQFEMQLKYLNFYQTMCKTDSSVKYYKDNIVPSVKSATNCVSDVEMVIEKAYDLVKEYETQSSSKDYKKVPDHICNVTVSACEHAMKNLNIGRSSITSRAVGSLKILSHGLTKKERDDFLEALYDLEDAEDELRKLCEQTKSNVKYRYSIDELKELINNIGKAMKAFRKQIRVIPTEDSAAKVIQIIEKLEDDIKQINAILGNPTKTQSVAGSSAQSSLGQ